MTVGGANLVRLQMTRTNAGDKPMDRFAPTMCWMLHSQIRSHAYTFFPQQGRPFSFAAGHFEVAQPPMWSAFARGMAYYQDSEYQRKRIAAGEKWKPQATLIREVGDFPMIARRLPGRDAWIAVIWPHLEGGYF